MNLYRRIVFYYRPFLGSIFVSILLLLAAIALNLLKPWPVKFVIDEVLKQDGGAYHLPFWNGPLSFEGALLVSVVSLVLIHLLWGVFNLFNNYWLVGIGLRALLRLRTEVYAWLQSLPLHYHDSHKSGDSTFRVAYDTQAIQTFFNRGFATIIGSSLTLVGTFMVMFQMNPRLSLLSLMVVPLLLAAIWVFASRIRRESMRLQQEESDVMSRASEGLGSIRIVHAFGREEFEVSQFERECEQSLEANRKLTLTNVLSSLVVGSVTALGSAVLLYYGAQEVRNGHLKVGDLYIFISYLVMLYQPLEQLSYTAWAMEGAAAGASRVFEILDTENDVRDLPGAADFKPAGGRIELQNIGFGYESGRTVLGDVSLVVEPGQTVAIVGGTGAGKTTVLSMVPRFYDPDSGRVLVDGQDVKHVKKSSLRSQISLVLQDTVLLNGTVAENIAYGCPQATLSQVMEAARAAQGHEFISAMPQGYDTQVGERGVRLSGGQRQRIGIARAFLRNSPILLLDEPTSALDLKTEAELMGALKNVMQRPTTLIVTHRLATIHDVERIYVMEHGRVVESGSGPELLARGGLYASLWHAADKQ
ncbi:MAG: ABC transporter ATP-binding protein [Methylacidiphilales bacterium]|nr:ABC transporter ATP-binding protein [Candidatus Methylacidiphilales bacterium]